jgi:hypothetical protein
MGRLQFHDKHRLALTLLARGARLQANHINTAAISWRCNNASKLDDDAESVENMSTVPDN